MILVAILALSGVVIAVLVGVLRTLPVIPRTFVTVVNQVLPYVGRGIKFVNGFMYPSVVWPLAAICLTLHAFWVGYRLVMWVMKKIPMFGVSD